MADPSLSGLHHVTLNVQDVARSETWYNEVLGFVRVAGYAGDSFERVIMVHPCGAVIGLNRHSDPIAAEPFSERRAGLDHLAFAVPDRATLEGWVARFDARDVSHSEVKSGAVPGSFLVAFRDPDDIQLEVFAPASQ